MRTLPIALAVLLALLVPQAVADESKELAAGIGGLAKPLVDGGVVSGMAIGVIRGGESHRFAYGSLPAGADSVFEIGSVTKVFTAYVLADMVRDGTVRLDQPVRELLPEGAVVPKFGDREITLLDLATHRSGLPRMPSNFAPADRTNPYADYDEKRLLAYLAEAELAVEPGRKKLYSNLGMGLLGHALALEAGTTYEELLAVRVTGPLGLQETTITLTDELKKLLAPGHNADLGAEPNWDLSALAGAGAVRSTVADMLRFLAAHFEPTAGVPDRKLGWQPGAMPGSVWHNGQTGGYHSMAIVVPGRKLAVVVLADTASKRVDELAGKILRLLAGEKVDPPKVRRPIELEAESLEACVGRYRYPPNIVFEVTRDEKGLLVRMPNQPVRRLFAESETRFFLRVVPVTLVFEKDESGKVVDAVLHQGGRQVRAPRVE